MPPRSPSNNGPERDQLECFVIMPFGEKADTDGKIINFDVVYRYIIRAAIDELNASDNRLKINCTRCDDIEAAGSIDTDMFKAILEADVAIVDITSLNANVFYELGMRHALRECVTIIIRREIDNPPFNIQGLRAIGYDPGDVRTFDRAKKTIQSYIESGLRTKRVDSPVKEALPNLRVSFPRKALRSGDRFMYSIPENDSISLGVLTGNMQELRNIADIWVSSENTDLQLARYHERSLSGLIRYLGAEKKDGRIIKDTIGDAVLEKAEQDEYDQVIPVNPGSVMATDSGDLESTHGVRRIYHAATVQGTPGHGYQPVPNITVCVTTALSIADSENKEATKARAATQAKKAGRDYEYKSILFPVFGTGVAEADFRKSAQSLISAALNHIENNGSTLQAVYFLAFDRPQLTGCLDVLDDLVRSGRLKPSSQEENSRK